MNIDIGEEEEEGRRREGEMVGERLEGSPGWRRGEIEDVG